MHSLFLWSRRLDCCKMIQATLTCINAPTHLKLQFDNDLDLEILKRNWMTTVSAVSPALQEVVQHRRNGDCASRKRRQLWLVQANPKLRILDSKASVKCPGADFGNELFREWSEEFVKSCEARDDEARCRHLRRLMTDDGRVPQ